MTGAGVFIAGFGQIASGQSGALVVLERDAASTVPGQHLRFRQALRKPAKVALSVWTVHSMSPLSTRNIYVAAERSNAVTHFRRTRPRVRSVFFVASYADGGSIDGLFGAAAVNGLAGWRLPLRRRSIRSCRGNLCS